MVKDKLKKITLEGWQVEALHVREDDFDYDEENERHVPSNGSSEVDGFLNWYVLADEETGSYDGGKSSMVDYEVDLYDDKDELRGTAIGGYYNAHVGHSFSHTLTFEPPKPRTPVDDFNEFLSDLSNEGGTIDGKMKKINKFVEKLKNK
jgi:hypothetical protein